MARPAALGATTLSAALLSMRGGNLAARDDQSLPELVEGFLRNVERGSEALAPKGTALIVECADAEIAARIANGEETAGLCMAAGERCLAVSVKSDRHLPQGRAEAGLRPAEDLTTGPRQRYVMNGVVPDAASAGRGHLTLPWHRANVPRMEQTPSPAAKDASPDSGDSALAESRGSRAAVGWARRA